MCFETFNPEGQVRQAKTLGNNLAHGRWKLVFPLGVFTFFLLPNNFYYLHKGSHEPRNSNVTMNLAFKRNSGHRKNHHTVMSVDIDFFERAFIY